MWQPWASIAPVENVEAYTITGAWSTMSASMTDVSIEQTAHGYTGYLEEGLFRSETNAVSGLRVL